MYRAFDDENGYPPRFYRSPEEIRQDILGISKRISEVNEELNIRELLSVAVEECCEENIAKRAEALSELLQFSLEALSELSELNDTLETLKEEYVQVTEILK